MSCAIGYCVSIALVLPPLFIHSFFPFLFEETASQKIRDILKKMETIEKDV